MDSATDETASNLGYSDVKIEQREAIEAIASGHETTTGQPYKYIPCFLLRSLRSLELGSSRAHNRPLKTLNFSTIQ